MYILDDNGKAPLYIKLYNGIREGILSKALQANAKLPSVRDLANQLSISRNTVQNAYLELQSQGYIYSKPQSGYFISSLDVDIPITPHDEETNVPFFHKHNNKIFDYSFHPASIDPNSFPVKLWRRLSVECLAEDPDSFDKPPHMKGLWELRHNIHKYLEKSRGVVCRPEQIVICAGLQNSLDLIAQLLRDMHSVVGVEDPGYPLSRSVFCNHGFDIRAIPIGSDGLKIERLQSSDCGVVYVTPSHQFPMGCAMPLANRIKLINWATAGGKYIIEDDYDSELRYLGRPLRSIQGLCPEANICYIGTFSKVLSPSVRTSYMVLPKTLLENFQNKFINYLSPVPLLTQRVLARLMEQGHFERHIRRMRTIYKEKQALLLRAINRHFGPRATVLGGGAGLHILLEIRGDLPDEQAIIERVAARGILLLPFSRTRVNGIRTDFKLLLGFGGMNPMDIERSMEILSLACLKT